MPPPIANQPPPYEGRNLYARRRRAAGGGRARRRRLARAALAAWGATLGAPRRFALATPPIAIRPSSRTLDRRGERDRRVDFHPAWHELMRSRRPQASTRRRGRRRAPARRSRAPPLYLLHAQVENGTQCPLTMTYAGVPVLRAARRRGAVAG